MVVVEQTTNGEARTREHPMARKQPDPVDIEVGRKVRAQRLEKDMSQEKLGQALGLTFQQVQKYEKGTNRISAGRLQRIAEILEVPTQVFFADARSARPPSDGLFELVDTGAALRLLRAYSRIPNPSVKRALTTLAEELAADARLGGA
jgi:transcriptional regulator with XRE-family HTH domain